MIFPKNTKEIRTVGYALRRTNYGEADRIIDFITPEGKIAGIARGVRKPKSKLAAGVELFTRSELYFHAGKGDLAILTNAKIEAHHSEVLKDFERMECAGMILKKVDRLAEAADAECYKIVKEGLEALNAGIDVELVRAYAELNLLKAMGEEPNFYRDTKGEKLEETSRYEWDVMEKALNKREDGKYGAEEIKILRLLTTSNPRVVARVRGVREKMPEISWIVKLMVK